MSLVAWIGKPDHWTPPDVPLDVAKWVLAADEEALPDVILTAGGHHISAQAALNAVDRYALRNALGSQFNPDWTTFEYRRQIVVKAPASSASSGVRLLAMETPENAIVAQLRHLVNDSRPLRIVVEEFIEGDAVELSGVKLNGRVFFFHPLRQHWTKDCSRIERYERAYNQWRLYELTVDALRYIKLDNSAFCIEWRVVDHETAKVIEINPRLGDDDKGYFEALWDIPVAEQIERWATDVYLAESPETAQETAQAAQG